MADRKETPDMINLLQGKRGPGRPTTKVSKDYSKRTIFFNNELWQGLEVSAFIQYGKSGSVTLMLHEAAREYLQNHPANLPDDVKQLKELIIKHAHGPRRR